MSRASKMALCSHVEIQLNRNLLESLLHCELEKQKSSLPAVLICPSLFPVKLLCVSRFASQRREAIGLSSQSQNLGSVTHIFGEIKGAILALLLSFCNFLTAQS